MAEEAKEKQPVRYRRSTRRIPEHFSQHIEEQEDDNEAQYLREKRTRQKGSHQSHSNNSSSYFSLLLLSFLLSLSFYSFPLFHRLATGITATNLYSGFAMNHGVLPYNEIFGSSGPLFYLVNQVGSVGNSTFVLWIIEVLALWATGLLTYRFMLSSRGDQQLSFVVAMFSLLTVAGISLGGDQAVVFALPFALYGIQVLQRYFEDIDAARDEVFILYGISGALASLFFPTFVLLWLFGFFALLATNIRRRVFGRAFYQFLASLFGFLLICAVVGYYTLTSQIFFSVIEQAFILPFTHYNMGVGGLINFGISLLLLLLFGLISSLFFSFNELVRGKHRAWTIFLIFIALLSIVLVSFMNGYVPANALVALPYLFMFIGFHLDDMEKGSRNLLTGHVITRYLRSSLFLPIGGLILLVAFPFAHQAVHTSLLNSEKSAASYLKEVSKPDDSVLVIGGNTNINFLSKRVCEVIEPPKYYPADYQQKFDIQVSASKSKYLVLNKKETASSAVKELIKSSYKETKFTDEQFKIYQMK